MQFSKFINRALLVLSLLSFSNLYATSDVISDESDIESLASGTKKEIKELQKEIKAAEKAMLKLRKTEQALIIEEDVIKKQAWAEAGKRKKRRNKTKIKRKEQRILDQLTAKRKELSAVQNQLTSKKREIEQCNRKIAQLTNKPQQAPAPKVNNGEVKVAAKPAKKSSLSKETKKWLGTRYRYGGNTKSGIDCSGLTCQVYKSTYNISIPRSSADQHAKSKKVGKHSLKEGDLVFFKIKKNRVNHVGIYLGNGEFVHASSSRGVMISKLSEAYYKKYFIGGGRYK
ncbi:C40 family peptidase [Saccharicrinis aurantiacus]|uniref:C40 family peptidase n=1 Tax=Saccharicrinis aurantiacus TaxID=1849719 RepID=UPI000838258A|nr:C40 family peptidase [Saccharicrinis aurantiacus]